MVKWLPDQLRVLPVLCQSASEQQQLTSYTVGTPTNIQRFTNTLSYTVKNCKRVR